MRRMVCLQQSREGFTFMELLIVFAILSIMVALFFPIFTGARDKARTAVCQSTLKQLYATASTYCSDYGRLPAPGFITHVLTSSDNQFICPEADGQKTGYAFTYVNQFKTITIPTATVFASDGDEKQILYPDVQFRKGTIAFRHGKDKRQGHDGDFANLLFADGHVKAFSQHELGKEKFLFPTSYNLATPAIKSSPPKHKIGDIVTNRDGSQAIYFKASP